jgi:FAD:protein FMN transferase
MAIPWARTGAGRHAPFRRVLAPSLGVVLLSLLLPACSLFDPDPVSVTFQTMGTQATLTVAGSESDKLAEAEHRVREAMTRLDAELSVYQPESAVSRLNRLAGIEPVEMPGSAWRLLELSKQYGNATGGAFDVTIGPLLQVWRQGRGRSASVPSEQAIAEAVSLVDYRQIRLGDNAAFLPRRGMSVDFGAIGKGYAVDAAWEECRRSGASNFMVDLGGNLRVAGHPNRATTWTVAVRNPFDPTSTVARLRIESGRAVATSGQYERFVEAEGRRYGHIIDPRTGYPASGLAAVTVVAPDAVTADVLSTSLFVLGPQAGLPVLRQAGAEALLIPDKEPLELWSTPRLAPHLHTLGRTQINILGY